LPVVEACHDGLATGGDGVGETDLRLSLNDVDRGGVFFSKAARRASILVLALIELIPKPAVDDGAVDV